MRKRTTVRSFVCAHVEPHALFTQFSPCSKDADSQLRPSCTPTIRLPPLISPPAFLLFRGAATPLPSWICSARTPSRDVPGELLIVHRPDKDAGSVMVLARSIEAQRQLTQLWSKRNVEKVYLALVSGFVPADGEVALPLLVNRDRRRVLPSPKHGKPAQTAYRILERLPGLTLLECRPLTGRLHQTRVHLAHIGHPLAIDPLYGRADGLFLSHFKSDYRPSRFRSERPLINRLTLHAQRLSFDHPDGT